MRAHNGDIRRKQTAFAVVCDSGHRFFLEKELSVTEGDLGTDLSMWAMLKLGGKQK